MCSGTEPTGQQFASIGSDAFLSNGLTRSVADVSELNDQLVLRSQGPETGQKLRGGYYTPGPIAEFLAHWAILDKDARVLEPSAGDGEAVAAAARRLGGGGRITAVELDHEEAEKVMARGGASTTVIKGDFFTWFRDCRPDGAFDAVLGNPPFIRYQDFPEEHRGPAFRLMREEGLRPSRLTNAWVPFVVMATRALRPGGRLALVLPAELLQVTYAAELREYLARKYAQLSVVTFRRLVFSSIQQETVLLLGTRQDGTSAKMSFVELDGVDGLRADQVNVAGPVEADLDHAREKWTQYYLSPVELGLIREVERSSVFGRLGDFAGVDVGVVTGRNEFFVLTRVEAQHYGVLSRCVPLVGRSAQIPGLVIRQDEWERLAAHGGKCLLMQLGNVERSELSRSALKYVESGERLGYHEGYKCAVRLPRWWNVPSAWVPGAFLLRQIHDGPRIIQNRAGATSTDTIHRVRIARGVDSAWLAAASVNSLTFAFSEIRGRSYGGGVLELEPTEAEGLPFPRPDASAQPLPTDDLDALVRRKGVQAALDEVDRLVLRPAGLGDRDVAVLRGVWRKLSERRMSRTHTRERR
ncbi:MAG: class I SAM-dependent methyltransferase [Chloroflexi bacterium]|nr:class I SAM-dependent methyltransferase [Chloroflexota bacterium]